MAIKLNLTVLSCHFVTAEGCNQRLSPFELSLNKHLETQNETRPSAFMTSDALSVFYQRVCDIKAMNTFSFNTGELGIFGLDSILLQTVIRTTWL